MRVLVSELPYALVVSESILLGHWCDSLLTLPLSVKLEACSADGVKSYSIFPLNRLFVEACFNVLWVVNSCNSVGMS